ncbi:MAG: HAD family hydrolase [Bdellovibrio sp.]|nr:MAG: HAD family hydrolase [Bdellovibrio sp.]
MPQKIAQRIFSYVKPFKHVIWDWNGTLINDVQETVSVLGNLMRRYKLRPLSVSEYKKLFCFPVYDFYKQVGFDLSYSDFKSLSNEFYDLYAQRLEDAELFEGVLETLELIGNTRVQSILSAANQEHLEEVVRKFGIHVHFTHIYGALDKLAAGKLERGQELIQASGIRPEETILVGDTDHDFEVAQKLGIECLLIADGHQNLERLSQVHHKVLPSRFPGRKLTESSKELI